MAWFQVSFYSECYARTVPVNVLIPTEGAGTVAVSSTDSGTDSPGPASAGRGEPFRTLYLLHGYTGNYTSWLLNGQVAEISKQFRLAIVIPSGYNGDYVDQPRSGIRGSTFLGCELVDFSRKLFPLSDKREDTIIGGLSMGGFGALYNALRFPGIFGHAVSLSAPIGFRDIAENDREYFEALHGNIDDVKHSDRNLELSAKTLLESGRERPELYIACGYNDRLVDDSREYSAYLTSIGYGHVYEEGPGTHDWSFWNDYLRRGLENIIPDLPPMRRNPFWIEKASAQ